MISIGTISQRQSVLPFALSALALAFVAATMSVCAPIAFSIATVFLFAGPHNWIELRYFLSRMPSRFGQLKGFFSWSFIGLGFLMTFYLGLVIATNTRAISDSACDTMFTIWNSLLIMWVVRLTVMAGACRKGRDWGWAVPLGFFVISGIWLAPSFFWLSLIYLHPLVGLCILDREISRSRPDLLRTYRYCLAAIPALLSVIWWRLAGSSALLDSDLLSWQIMQHAGAGVLTGCSSHLLVSTHTFLEMIHYGVWLLAIPFVSSGWQAWQPRSIPMIWRSPKWGQAISMLLVFSSFVVVALWCAFAFNYSVTREIYFTLALAHVLAEFPFLLKALM